jgi:Tfp pilus assembly protein PilW
MKLIRLNDPTHRTSGMTLIEVLISLVLLMVILGAVYSVLHLQQSRAANVQTTATLQTDAQIALSIFRWDIFMAGYGMAQDTNSVVSWDVAGTYDSITLYGAGLAYEAFKANWSPILEIVQNDNDIIVYDFPDTAQNFKVGNRLIIIAQNKTLLDSGLVVGSVDTVQHLGGTDTIPALRVSLNRNVNVGQGAIAVCANHNTYFNGVTYHIANNRLFRENDAFLDNVEDLQFAYGCDLNDNGTFDSTEWFNSLGTIPNYQPSLLYQHKFSVRATFVMRSDQKLANYKSWTRGYNINADNVQVENHQYSILNTKGFRREFVSTITQPRNVRF